MIFNYDNYDEYYSDQYTHPPGDKDDYIHLEPFDSEYYPLLKTAEFYQNSYVLYLIKIK